MDGGEFQSLGKRKIKQDYILLLFSFLAKLKLGLVRQKILENLTGIGAQKCFSATTFPKSGQLIFHGFS
jgi:hypothetical protein